MAIKNVEIKARCKNPDEIRSILRSLNATFIGKDHQVDTYYECSTGRLKLREGNIENALIYYNRPDDPNPKLSDIALYKSQEPKALKQLLDASLKTIVVVDKQREIYFIDHIKIHVDEVLNLGDFLEIEVIDKTDTMEVETMHQECNELMKKFNLDASLLLRNSYSDMLMSKV